MVAQLTGMKIVLLIFVATCCMALPTPDDWEEYKAKFNKSYSDPVEDQKRKEIFLENQKYVENHNKKYREGTVTYEMGINQFSDKTEEEMKSYLGLRRPDTTEDRYKK